MDIESSERVRQRVEHLLESLVLPEETGSQLGQVTTGDDEPQPAPVSVDGEHGVQERERQHLCTEEERRGGGGEEERRRELYFHCSVKCDCLLPINAHPSDVVSGAGVSTDNLHQGLPEAGDGCQVTGSQRVLAPFQSQTCLTCSTSKVHYVILLQHWIQ